MVEVECHGVFFIPAHLASALQLELVHVRLTASVPLHHPRIDPLAVRPLIAPNGGLHTLRMPTPIGRRRAIAPLPPPFDGSGATARLRGSSRHVSRQPAPR